MKRLLSCVLDAIVVIALTAIALGVTFIYMVIE